MSKHPIVHIEVPAKDPKAASKFYADVFGWELKTYEEFDYVTFNPGDGPGGGFPKAEDIFQVDRLLVYIETDDIEASLKKAESLGAKTARPKTEIPGQGWYAIFTDPEGNHIALYTGMNAEG